MAYQSVFTYFYPSAMCKFMANRCGLEFHDPEKLIFSSGLMGGCLFASALPFQSDNDIGVAAEDYIEADNYENGQRVMLKDICSAYLRFLRKGIRQVMGSRRAKKITWSKGAPTIQEQEQLVAFEGLEKKEGMHEIARERPLVFENKEQDSERSCSPRNVYRKTSSKPPEHRTSRQARSFITRALVADAAETKLASNVDFPKRSSLKSYASSLVEEDEDAGSRYPETVSTVEMYQQMRNGAMMWANPVQKPSVDAVSGTISTATTLTDDTFQSYYQEEDSNGEFPECFDEETFKSLDSEDDVRSQTHDNDDEYSLFSGNESNYKKNDTAWDSTSQQDTLNNFDNAIPCNLGSGSSNSHSMKNKFLKDDIHEVFLYWLEQLYNLEGDGRKN